MIGQTFEGSVRALTFKGLGVVDHPDGPAFFVRGTWPGDEGVFEIESFKKNYGFAKLTHLKKPSSARRSAPCPHLGFETGLCSGCPWMIATYESQLSEKEKMLKSLLQRSQLLEDETVLTRILASPEEFGYRNRAQLKTDGEKLGYVSAASNVIADIQECIILTPKNQITLKELRSKLPNKNWKPKPNTEWNTLEIDEVVEAKDVVLNQKRAFQQGNTAQNNLMREWVAQKVKTLDKSQEVLELFCGSGNFTEVLSKANFSKIVASEMSPVAIRELKDKNLNNVLAVEANIFSPRSWGALRENSNAEILFLDPPRDGFKDLGDFLKKFSKIKTIIYISCDISTYIHDCKQALKLGYKIKELVPLDQFPQTPHLEILSILELSK